MTPLLVIIVIGLTALFQVLFPMYRSIALSGGAMMMN